MLSIIEPASETSLLHINIFTLIQKINRRLGEKQTHKTESEKERVILAGVDWFSGGIFP